MAVQTPDEFRATLRQAGQQGFAQMLARQARGLALFGEAQAKQNATRAPRARSGNLRRSIAGTVESDLGSARVVLSAGGRIAGGGEVPYATTQEYGGTIRPRRRKWLAIPTDAVKTGAGVSRYQTPRDYPEPLAFVKLSPTQAMLLDKSDGRAKWWLRKSTTIKPKWFMRDAMRETEKQAPGQLSAVLSDALEAE